MNYTIKINQKLKALCDDLSILFLDTHYYYATKDGVLDAKKSDGIVHIHPDYNNFIKKRLCKLILERNLLCKLYFNVNKNFSNIKGELTKTDDGIHIPAENNQYLIDTLCGAILDRYGKKI